MTTLIKGTFLLKTNFSLLQNVSCLASSNIAACRSWATLPLYLDLPCTRSLLPVSTDNIYKCNWLVFAKPNYKWSMWYFINLALDKTGLGPLIPIAIAWRKYGWFSLYLQNALFLWCKLMYFKTLMLFHRFVFSSTFCLKFAGRGAYFPLSI